MVLTPESIKEINHYLKTQCIDEERLQLLEAMGEGICEHCGCIDLDNFCQCWNDE